MPELWRSRLGLATVHLAILSPLLRQCGGQSASPCWADGFSFASCCLMEGMGTAKGCWSEAYTYERCCLTSPLLSTADVTVLEELTDEALDCGCKPQISQTTGRQLLGPSGSRFLWCEFRQAVMLNWDLRNFYPPFLEITVAELAQCPLGAMTMMLLETNLKLTSPRFSPELTQLPGFLWTEAAFVKLLEAGKVTLGGITNSGWTFFFQLSNVGPGMRRRESPARLRGPYAPQVEGCLSAPPPGSASAKQLERLADSVWDRPLDMEEALRLMFLQEHGSAAPCPLLKATWVLAVANAVQQQMAVRNVGPRSISRVQTESGGTYDDSDSEKVRSLPRWGEVQRLINLAEKFLRETFALPGISAQPLSLLVCSSPWLVAEQAEALSHPGRLAISLSRTMEGNLGLDTWSEGGANQPAIFAETLKVLASSPQAIGGNVYMMRVFPFREMASDIIRYTKYPFCGARPFMRMVALYAERALAAGCSKAALNEQDARACEFTFVEGGPHLGDCSLWAGSVLRLAGVHLRSMAFEPLPDASNLFKQAVVENELTSSVSVTSAAMSREGVEKVEMVYFRGHNGQATINGPDFHEHAPGDVALVHNVPVAVLDHSVPASWPVVDVLKLSVNGGERDTMAGARRLLTSRRICSVLLHTKKAARGRKGPTEIASNGMTYSEELLSLLTKVGGMEVYTHRDFERSPVNKRVTGAGDLDAAFDDPTMSGQDYIMARSPTPQCAHTRPLFDIAMAQQAGSVDRGSLL